MGCSWKRIYNQICMVPVNCTTLCEDEKLLKSHFETMKNMNKS